MGYNEYGQLGDGSTVNRATPVEIATDVASASVGSLHTLFVKTDGSLWATGYNISGQLGDGSITSHTTPEKIANGVASASAADFHSSFLKTDGTLWAMGYNGYGQLGDGSSAGSITPIQVATGITSVSAGGSHTLFIGATHTITFDLGTHATRSGGGALTQTVITGTAIAPTLNVATGWVFIGWDVAFAKATTDLTATAQYIIPTLPVISLPPSPLEVPWQGSAVLTVTASANGPPFYQWYQGESGDTTTPVSGATGPLLVTSSLTTTTRFWVRVINGDLWINSPAATVTVVAPFRPMALGGMGDNTFGELGGGATANFRTPMQIANGILACSVGSSHSLIVKTDGSLWDMGVNVIYSFMPPPSPVWIASGVGSVSTSGRHTLFVKTNGSLWGIGDNNYGQLGDGSIAKRSSPVLITTGVACVSTGAFHSLFIKTNGSLWAMGLNDYDQLGDGSGINRASPILVASDVGSVSAGYNHTLFVKTDGSLWAMGENSSGQLGDGSTTHRATPVQVATDVAFVSAGDNHTSFVKTDGTLWSMGDNHHGQLGDGSTTNRSNPVPVTSGVASVDAGPNNTFFVKTDGSLWAMGNNLYGQLGDGSMTSRITPIQITSGVASVSAGSIHTVFLAQPYGVTFTLGAHATRSGGGALTQEVIHGTAAREPSLIVANGWVFTGWDFAFTSVTTDLAVTAQYVPPTLPLITTLPPPRDVAWQASATLTITATANGPLLYQWYRGESDDTTSPIPGATAPLLVTPPLATTTRFWARIANSGLSIDSPATTVTVIGAPAHALTLGGMGDNYSGQLGDGSTIKRITPISISSDLVAVSAGANHSLFIKTNGSLWAMGNNSDGQLGDGSWINRITPIQVATDVTSVSTSSTAFSLHGYTLFVKTNGSLWAMGYNNYGQLGDGSWVSRSTPVPVATGVSSVSASVDNTLFIKTDGSLWGMGYNISGALGDGSTTRRMTPIPIATGVASVSVGGFHSLFVKTDGSLWATGYNHLGQLGDGTKTNRTTPIQVATGVTSVSAGNAHTLFVKIDGSLWAMGDNSYGQLGDGTKISRTTPIQIAAGVASASAGSIHTLFVKTDRSLWAVGSNKYGQLGDRTTTFLNFRTPPCKSPLA